MNDFNRILDARIDDLYLSDIGFEPINNKRNSGRCPIHPKGSNKKKANFSFIEKGNKRLYTCWSDGCVRGADIIEVCRVKENLAERIDAVRFLADRYGIELNEFKKKELTEEEKKALEKKKQETLKRKKAINKLDIATKRALESSNLELAFKLSCMQDKVKEQDSEIKEEDLELVNYSNYKANDYYFVDKYISEDDSGFKNALFGAYAGQVEAVFSPTGSGKTYSLARLLHELNFKALIILPLQSNVEQFIQEYKEFNVDGAFGDIPIARPFKRNSRIIAMTWDKAAQLATQDFDIDFSEYILVADEIHQTMIDIFRENAISGFFRLCKKVRGRLDMTATPNKLDFSIYDNITEYFQSSQTNYKVKIYDYVSDNEVINIINNSNKSAVLLNHTRTLAYIASRINKKSTIIHSDNKALNSTYENIMSNCTLGDTEVLLNTSTIVAGVNIKEPNVTDIIVVGEKDIATIRQYVARFRNLDEVNVHIFNKFEEDSHIYLIESLIDKELEQARALAELYTSLTRNHTEFGIVSGSIKKDTIKGTSLGSLVYFNEETAQYEVNEFAVRSRVYQAYYNKRTIEQFKVLLEEYFYNTEIIDEINLTKLEKESKEQQSKSKYIDEMVNAKLDALEILEENKEYLVGYEFIIKHNITPTILDYWQANGYSFNDIMTKYNDLNLKILISETRTAEVVIRYSNYVLKQGFSTEVAWKIANMGNLKRGNFFKKLNAICYRKLRDEYNNVVNKSLVENQLFDFLTKSLTPGTSYTQMHLEEFVKDIKNKFGDNKEFTVNKIGTVIKNTYLVEEKRIVIEKLPQVDCIFYRNIKPTCGNSKQIRYYTINRYLWIEDIKKELAVTSSDLSLDRYVSKQIEKQLSKFGLTQSDAKFIEIEDIENIF